MALALVAVWIVAGGGMYLYARWSVEAPFPPTTSTPPPPYTSPGTPQHLAPPPSLPHPPTASSYPPPRVSLPLSLAPRNEAGAEQGGDA